MTLVYLPLRLASLWSKYYFNVSLNESYKTPRIGVTNSWEPAAKTKYFSWNIVRSQYLSDQFGEELTINLRKKSLVYGEK